MCVAAATALSSVSHPPLPRAKKSDCEASAPACRWRRAEEKPRERAYRRYPSMMALSTRVASPASICSYSPLLSRCVTSTRPEPSEPRTSSTNMVRKSRSEPMSVCWNAQIVLHRTRSCTFLPRTFASLDVSLLATTLTTTLLSCLDTDCTEEERKSLRGQDSMLGDVG
eukprot:767057-Hanusia_phi.AAC.4